MQKLAVICLVAFAYISCNNLENKKIQTKLEKIESESPFTLDSVETKEWDTLYVLTPYNKVTHKIKFPISDDLKETLNRNCMFDSFCTLVFVKDNQIISYSAIKRDVADFTLASEDNKYCFPSSQQFELDENRNIIINANL